MTAMRSRSSFLVAWCLLVLLPSLVSAQTSVSVQSGDDQAHLRWLSETLASVQAIKAGMTRRDLLTIFKQDGGLQVGAERYVYKQCPIIKVDVTFTASDTGDNQDDRIKSISKPYLENPFFD